MITIGQVAFILFWTCAFLLSVYGFIKMRKQSVDQKLKEVKIDSQEKIKEIEETIKTNLITCLKPKPIETLDLMQLEIEYLIGENSIKAEYLINPTIKDDVVCKMGCDGQKFIEFFTYRGNYIMHRKEHIFNVTFRNVKVNKETLEVL